MTKYAGLISKPVPQSEALDERQVKNNAGGYVYQIDKWSRLDRFLILGSDAPTYYQSAPALTRENAKSVTECYAEDGARTVRRIVEISHEGRAPKNDAAIFALALGAIQPETETRQLALAALSAVCRTSTHMFQFVKTARALGKGFGRALKRAVADWYTNKEVDRVAYQAIKYRSREGYTHKRLLDMSHAPSAPDPVRQNLYHWMKGKNYDPAALPPVVEAHLLAMDPITLPATRLELIKKFELPWEALPTECNADPEVWNAMLPHLGLTALIRNLGNMTRIGAIKPLSKTEAEVVRRLGNEEDLRKSRIHPYAVLQAMAVYGAGRGLKGGGVWTPSQPVLDALDRAFYKTFANVKPTGKRYLNALDVSGSMGTGFIGGVLSCREASAALALVNMSVEAQTHTVGFTANGNYWTSGTSITPLKISPRQRLTDAVTAISGLPFGRTDCAQPMLYALDKKLEVDVFTVYTDSETWSGSVHPMEALRRYRKETGIPAKLIVVGMTSTNFSIADPKDGGALDIVGFDSNCPALISDFATH